MICFWKNFLNTKLCKEVLPKLYSLLYLMVITTLFLYVTMSCLPSSSFRNSLRFLLVLANDVKEAESGWGKKGTQGSQYITSTHVSFVQILFVTQLGKNDLHHNSTKAHAIKWYSGNLSLLILILVYNDYFNSC